MYAKAIKRSVDEVEYKQHAWIDDDSRGAFVDGLNLYLPRRYQIGDRIAFDIGDMEVTETFQGFDFHTNEPLHCFNAEWVCRNCNKLGNHHKDGYTWADFVCQDA